ncbi:peptidoglycan-binding domain-containing protein [Streptomyces sp. WMMC500]|uniref:peptidoglycan-binding domain-containing protein n=1 Tax=Streptomyces sp. WMMC500 TaxID=3015154 RepID=UPI00248AECD4|nr:peptidoglycan-binding domain-containing protein [Streptomyces sp. WMMC500]WBB59639.1 peptidoglycan-binding domain-containing protein [Streptomyces sp. WMMC500]
MRPRACRTCGEPLQEQGGQGCACGAGGAEGGAGARAGGTPGRERPLVRPYVMKAPGPVGGRDGAGSGADGPPAPETSLPATQAAGGPPPGALPPGALPPGALPPGALPPGALPPGALPPGAPTAGGTLAVPYGLVGAAPEGPADADLGLFADDSAGGAPRGPYDDADDLGDLGGPAGPYDPRRHRDRLAARRRRRLTLVLTVGGVVAALSAGLLGSGLFSDDGNDDRAVPKPDTITAVPTGGGTEPGPEDTRSGAPTAAPDGENPAEPSATTSDRAAGGTGTGEGDPDAEPTGHTEAGQVTAAPPGSDPDPTAPADPTDGTTPDDPDDPPPPPTLRQGDAGREVTEMQKRLTEAGYGNFLLDSEGEFGWFTRQEVERFQRNHDVEGDDSGVYGPATRRALESMTKEP